MLMFGIQLSYKINAQWFFGILVIFLLWKLIFFFKKQTIDFLKTPVEK